MAGTATIEYILKGHSKESYILDVLGLSEAVSLANTLSGYVNAGISRVSFTDTSFIDLPEDHVTEFQSVEWYGVILFRNPSGDIVRLALPAVKKSLFDGTARGYVMPSAVGNTLGVALGAAKGVTLTFVRGSVTGKG